ncbi:MAG: GCN5-related N-acetyltransferase [Cyanobacteria bacterium RYN_339]|nr:GCN5-related N-acetyltransferase [Cyanobacteria bacterium RYN_339]
MPLSIRPFEEQDAPALTARFSEDARAPWLRLPYPFTLDKLLEPGSGLDVFVAAPQPERVVGLIAFDRRGTDPLMVGPLVSDEQLADLYVRALMGHGLDWARDGGLTHVRVKVDLGEERGLSFFLNQGFQLLESRQYLLAARRGIRRPAPTPFEGVRFGLSPEMLSSDYLRLYQELGWSERLAWSRPKVFEHLQQPGVHLLSARAGDTYLGFAELQVRHDAAELSHFGVLPAFRGRGVGSAFLEHVLTFAFEQLELERVWVATLMGEADKGPMPFFTKRGFRQERALVYLEKKLIPAASALNASSIS